MGLPSRRSIRRGEGKGLRALAAGSLSLARAHVELLKTEKFLESEIDKENRKPPDSRIGRIRFAGRRYMHSKNVLLFIVILNMLDCILVMGEIFLDIYYLKGIMDKDDRDASLFMGGIKQLYPQQLQDITETDLSTLFSRILSSTVKFHQSSGSHYTVFALQASDLVYSKADSMNTSEPLSDSNHSVSRRSVVNEMTKSNATLDLFDSENHQDFSYYRIKVKLAHIFHYCSISILGILVIENIAKIICSGREFLNRTIEVFDAVVVISSFVVDLVFIEGIYAFKIQKFLTILVILVPWRIIRVVNSLIVAINDQAHFRMKLLYKQKKIVSRNLKTSKNDIRTLQDCVQSLKEIAILAGVAETDVNMKIAKYQISKATGKTFHSSDEDSSPLNRSSTTTNNTVLETCELLPVHLQI